MNGAHPARNQKDYFKHEFCVIIYGSIVLIVKHELVENDSHHTVTERKDFMLSLHVSTYSVSFMAMWSFFHVLFQEHCGTGTHRWYMRLL